MLGKRRILIFVLVVVFAILGVILFRFIDDNSEPKYDISILHNGGMITPTYIRLSYDGQYEIYHGAFFHNKDQSIPSLYYDVKKENLSQSTLEEFIILVRDLEKKYVPPEVFPETNGGMGDLIISINENTYVCSLNNYDNRDCKEIMVNMYNIIKDEAPKFKEYYDELTKWDIQQ